MVSEILSRRAGVLTTRKQRTELAIFRSQTLLRHILSAGTYCRPLSEQKQTKKLRDDDDDDMMMMMMI